MPPRRSAAIESELFLSAAALAAHSGRPEGFRQRDLLFFFELFENWGSASGIPTNILQNTQLLRYLAQLCEGGFARKIPKASPPRYRLTRVGLLELVGVIARPARSDRISWDIFFQIYFLKAYKPFLTELVKKEGAQFPASLRIELEALLDVRQLIADEMSRLDRNIARLVQRVADAERTQTLTRRRLREGVPLAEVVREIEREIPYELNSRKPLSDLMTDVQLDQRQWEFTEGTVMRKGILWEPFLAELRGRRRLLAELSTVAAKTD